MTLHFVDTNIFLRYLTKDDPRKAAACFELFQKAKQGAVSLMTSESVIAEIVYTLSSKKTYNLDHQEIKRRLAPLIHLKGLKIPHKDTMIKALELYGVYLIDFEDCLSIAHMERQQAQEIYSYDRDFDHVQEIERIEP